MKILIILVIELCFVALSISQWISQGQTRSCVTPQNQYGSCVPLSYCPQVANIFQASNPQDGRQFLISLQRACGTRSINGDPVICCSRSLSVSSNMFAQRETQNPFFSSTISPALPPTTTIKIMPTTTIAPKAENKISGSCRDPNGKEGYCTGLATCQSLVNELYAKRDDISFKNFLRVSNAICGGMSTFVCCPGQEENKTSQKNVSASKIDFLVPTAKDGCGYSTNSYKKIVGGEPAKKGSWPWIALLGYDDDLSPNPFKCGGTLVTKRHIVTAAHCIRSDLTFARLGEHDLETLTEAKHIDVKIVMKIVHPEYNPKNGRADIAIVFLERNIELSDNISPICLPTSKELRNKSYVKYSPFVAGWGKTMMNGYSATVLQELQIPILENDECRRRYASRNRLFTQNQFDEAVICAGVLAGGKDTCQGDSGGPLMIPEPFEKSVRYYLIGVVSYGIGCAQPDIPGVYSSVQYFIDWILGEISKAP